MNSKKLLKQLIHHWSVDKVSTLSAGLSYYTIFSIAPLLIIAMSMAGLFFDPQLVKEKILEQTANTFGSDPANQIKSMISAVKPSTHLIAKLVSVIILLFGASGFFGALQTGLNTVWGVTPKSNRGLWGLIKDRFLSFIMVLGVGFLLLVSLVISALLALISNYINHFLPQFIVLTYLINFIVSIAGITLLFALIFKFIPDVQIQWKEVWLGAFFTALLFTIGKFLIGIYLAHSNLAKGFGAAGALILILVWVYYSAQILLIGAEFTKVNALEKGKQIKPKKNAKLIRAI